MGHPFFCPDPWPTRPFDMPCSCLFRSVWFTKKQVDDHWAGVPPFVAAPVPQRFPRPGHEGMRCSDSDLQQEQKTVNGVVHLPVGFTRNSMQFHNYSIQGEIYFIWQTIYDYIIYGIIHGIYTAYIYVIVCHMFESMTGVEGYFASWRSWWIPCTRKAYTAWRPSAGSGRAVFTIYRHLGV